MFSFGQKMRKKAVICNVGLSGEWKMRIAVKRIMQMSRLSDCPKSHFETELWWQKYPLMDNEINLSSAAWIEKYTNGLLMTAIFSQKLTSPNWGYLNLVIGMHNCCTNGYGCVFVRERGGYDLTCPRDWKVIHHTSGLGRFGAPNKCWLPPRCEHALLRKDSILSARLRTPVEAQSRVPLRSSLILIGPRRRLLDRVFHEFCPGISYFLITVTLFLTFFYIQSNSLGPFENWNTFG